MYSIYIYTKIHTLRNGETLAKETFTSSDISKVLGLTFLKS